VPILSPDVVDLSTATRVDPREALQTE